jgi:hypothetical protein
MDAKIVVDEWLSNDYGVYLNCVIYVIELFAKFEANVSHCFNGMHCHNCVYYTCILIVIVSKHYKNYPRKQNDMVIDDVYK